MALFDESKRKDYAVAKANQELFRNAIQHCMDGNLADLQRVLAKALEECGAEFSLNDIVLGFKAEGKTLLHIASSAGKLEVLSWLLSQTNDPRSIINAADDRGMTLLINATISESYECMKLLIDHGADVNCRNADGACALHFAAGDGNIPRIALLCSHNADLTFQSQSGTPLHWSAGKGHALAVKYFLSLPQAGELKDLPNSAGVPPVLMAAVCGSDESVSLLVEAGANVGAILAGNVTLLHICSEHGMRSAVEHILRTETGRKCCTIETTDGNTPLYLAAMAGHVDLVEMLLEHTPHTHESLSRDQQIAAIMAEGARRMQAYNEAHAPPSSQPSASTPAQSASLDASLQASLQDRVPVTEDDRRQAEAAKQCGNEHYRAHRYAEAVEAYSEAIRFDRYCAAYYSNRSACYLALQQYLQALQDAEVCRHLEPQWVKGCYRLAAARLAMNLFEDAAVAAFEGCKLEPQNKELKEIMQEAVRRGQEAHKKQQKLANASRS